MFDAVLADKVGDRRGTIKGRLTAAINGRVDEMFDIILESCIDEVFALFLFGFLL